MKKLIYDRPVNRSLLKEGITLSAEVFSFMDQRYHGVSRDKIMLSLNNKTFPVNLSFSISKDGSQKIYQIRYSQNSELAHYFQQIFKSSKSDIENQSKGAHKGQRIKTRFLEYFKLYATDDWDVFEGEIIVSNDNLTATANAPDDKNSWMPENYTPEISVEKLHAQQSQEGNGENVNYWWLNANPKTWSMSAAPVGEVQDYTLYNDNQHKRRVFQNFLDAKVGDMIIGYESTPVKQIVALFQISQEQDGERIYFKKIEHLAVPIDLATLQTQPELAEMEFFKNSQASLLKLSAAEYDCIINLIRDVNPLPQVRNIEEYGVEKFLSEVFMNRGKYDSLVHILQAKKNIILQGAPGVGKTFAARRLAYSIMGVKDDSRIEFVQFHQNYSYEDFVMGYKPNENGFELKNGIFYSFCQKAASAPDKDYFFIIDEINRGNMSKIFGELLMLIEKDYRGTSLSLAYNGLPFHVPKNLHIIGMMNTADRSLAMIDYALRRRFSFFPMEPGFNSEGFRTYQAAFKNETFDALIETVKDLNRAIKQDNSLGEGFCIGHSYFCGQTECTEEWMREVVNFDIIPMLQEYWFDDKQNLTKWSNALKGVFND